MLDGGQIKSSNDFVVRLARRLRLLDHRTTSMCGSVKVPFVKAVKLHGDHESETTAEYKLSKFDVLDVHAENKRLAAIDDFHLT